MNTNSLRTDEFGHEAPKLVFQSKIPEICVFLPKTLNEGRGIIP